ncbi:MAG: hypothetical protein RQ739_16755 [Desulfotignum sp.]|nr:hypothetical protein [Desulfotignum sp.]
MNHRSKIVTKVEETCVVCKEATIEQVFRETRHEYGLPGEDRSQVDITFYGMCEKFIEKDDAWGRNPQAGKHQTNMDKIMEFTLDSKVILKGLRSGTERQIRKLLTTQNPKFLEAKKMDRWTGNLKPVLKFYRNTPDGLICPRGAAAKLFGLCRGCGEIIRVIDNRLELDPVDFHFHGELRPLQADAVAEVMKRDHGTLSAPTGSGKTCMGLFIIAQRMLRFK